MSGKHAQGNVKIQNQLTQWINNMGMSEGGKKVNILRKTNEILLHQGSQYIPLFLENILSLGADKSNEVKKQVIVFIEQLSNLFPQYLPKAIAQMQLLIMDLVVGVQKRALQAASIVYRNSLQWICQQEGDAKDMQLLWEHLSKMKILILNMIDSENEGIRTHSIKFLEEVVLLQSPCELGKELEFNLHSVPPHVPQLDRTQLLAEADQIFSLIAKFHNSQHISSANLMACMTTLCLLAKSRPKYMAQVIQAYGDLHTTLPPTLTQSQVSSVRKHLKMLLINLVKHPASNDTLPQLTQLLLDIGMTTQEINKALPKEKRNKRLGEVRQSELPAKRFRVDSPQSISQGSDSNSRSDFTPFLDEDSSQSTVIQNIVSKSNITEDTILEGLNNVENVVALVMATLTSTLPTTMPAHFLSIYKPIPNSGSMVQKKSLSKLLLSVIKNEPVTEVIEPVVTAVLPPKVATPPPQTTPSLTDLAAKIPLLKDAEEEKITLKNAVAKLQESTKAERQIESAVLKLMEETRQEHLKAEEKKEKEKETEKLVPPQTPTVPRLKQKVKLLKLQEITRPIPKEIKEKLVIQAVDRILRAEKESAIGGAAQIRAKLITIFASSYTPEIRELVLSYILFDPLNRIDLGIAWLYEEYAFMQGFNRHPVTLQPKMHEKHDQNYNQLLCALITQICEQGDPNVDSVKEILIRKIYSECPLVTDEAVDYLKHLIQEEKVAVTALEILEELCIMRPPRAHKYVTSLVCHVLNHNEQVRELALNSTLKIYKRSTEACRKIITKHAMLYLGFISLSAPPAEVLGARAGGYRVPWTDTHFKLCMNLIMTLYPENEELIIEVARVYGCAGSEAKRVVLRAIEGPIRDTCAGAGPLRPALVALLDECPRGAETLLTRIVHIITEKAPPSEELVSKVRDLYATRVSDVRFLIPVLAGLTKKEILAALPKFIKLNPVVVKEVFNKLLGLQNPEENSPITPAELLVALHLIDPAKADLKYIIKATALCFGEKQAYTQDVVSAVLQRLTEQAEIPVLFMRSVLQALTLYPALASLTLNILQLLMEREVWNNKVAWEGWIKCCERLIPASTFLLLSLPEPALTGAIALPRLLTSLRDHVAAMPPESKATLPPHVARAAIQPEYAGVPLPVPPPGGNPLEPLPPGME